MTPETSDERVLLIHTSRSGDGEFRARVTHGDVEDSGSTVRHFAAQDDVVAFVRSWLAEAEAGKSLESAKES